MAQVSFKRGTSDPPQTEAVDGALYLKEDSEKFDLYFGSEENKILKLNAETATKLSTTRSIQTNLGSKSAASFDGSGDISPGVTGTLSIENGGTGATTAANALKNLGITATTSELNKMDGVTATTTEINYVDGVTSNIQTQLNGKAASSHNHAASNITSGTLSTDRLPIVPISKGGTGSTTAANARANLDAMSATNPVGTGSFSVGRLANSTVGIGSCSVGLQNTASGNYSSALGYNNTASGGQSFAVGNSNTASGAYSLAAGTKNKADSYGSCALGQLNYAKGEAGFAAGRYCLANGLFSVALGNKNSALANYSFVAGSENIAGVQNGTANYEFAPNYEFATTNDSTKGLYSVSIGYKNTASGNNSVAFGSNNIASGSGSIALGFSDVSSGASGNTASGDRSVAIGSNNAASGSGSVALGTINTASGNSSVALGYYNTAEGTSSVACGVNSTALNYQMAFGHFNNQATATAGVASGPGAGTAFVIGNGVNNSWSNAFRVNYDGQIYTKKTNILTGADYAEYFEWLDGNPTAEDRRGYFVTLDGDKIKIAEPNDYILGVISGQPAIIGNGDEDWIGRYVFDEFGAFVYEDFEYEEEVPETVIDEETDKSSIVTKTVKKIGKKYKENPDYDPSRGYIQREDRPEWDAVGMVGVLFVRDDGTCKVNGFCKVADSGIATASETGYRVIKRVNENIVKIIFK